MITWGAGQRAAAQSGAWGPSQRPARRGGLRAEMHDRRMPESMQHEPWVPTLCDPMASSPPGSSVLDISQARILECPLHF